ncbi:uncharacterized protein TNCV_3524601 [Trichonephila clavipes]|uniref:Uncharacterized protein n=1 Tax=Trichonephila clavipes TaxID=2585209 RepID=A0A8X6VBL9_TRICX|nr:uncharacterized protein TNCV_3524601 [Trichonephila clavipes]
MERVPKSPVTFRCRMERGDVLQSGLFVRRLFEFHDRFYFRISQLIFWTLSSLHGSNADFDGVVTWRTIGPITPNFFSILEQYLQLSGHSLLERASAFPCADSFLWRISTSYSCSLYIHLAIWPSEFLKFSSQVNEA